MGTIKTLWASIMDNPTFMVRFNIVGMIVWGILLLPSVFWWGKSLEWVVLMSWYAIFTGHLSAWQAARVEKKQDEMVGKDDRLHGQIPSENVRNDSGRPEGFAGRARRYLRSLWERLLAAIHRPRP